MQESHYLSPEPNLNETPSITRAQILFLAENTGKTEKQILQESPNKTRAENWILRIKRRGNR